MKKSTWIALAAVVLAAVLIVLAARAPLPAQFGSKTPLSVATSTINASTTDYTVEATFPQFGIPTIDAQIQKWIEAGIDDVKTHASQDKPSVHGFPMYDFTSEFNDVYIGSDYVSVRLVLGEYFGGAHEQPTIIGATFHRDSGVVVTLDEALALTGKALAQVAAQAKEQLKQNSDTQPTGIWSSGSDPLPENYQTFLINKDSVIFIFQPYQVAPYSSGAPEISIPRAK